MIKSIEPRQPQPEFAVHIAPNLTRAESVSAFALEVAEHMADNERASMQYQAVTTLKSGEQFYITLNLSTF